MIVTSLKEDCVQSSLFWIASHSPLLAMDLDAGEEIICE